MHRIDVAYCYRCRAFRCPYVSFCVGHMGEPCKTAEPIKMLLVAGRLARVQGTTFACFFSLSLRDERSRSYDGVHISDTW